MKKSIAVALTSLLAASLSYAASNEVFSVNVVGFQRLDIEGGGQYELASTPFETGEQTLLDIFGTNTLRQDNIVGACDKIRLWDETTQQYKSYAQWTDGLFYEVNGAVWSSTPTNPVIATGAGFWIQSSGATSGTTNTLSFVGDVIMSPSNTISIIEGYQIITYPFSAPIDLNDTDFLNCGASADNVVGACDRIKMWDGSKYVNFALWTDGLWYEIEGAKWGEKADGVILQPGQAFWYDARSAFEWTETNTYLNALD